MQIQEESLCESDSAETAADTVAEHSEMPYHYEFKEGSDEVDVSLHDEMKGLHKTTQASLVEMYESAVDNSKEFYGVDEVKLQEQQQAVAEKV